jgi:hypothetical protein
MDNETAGGAGGEDSGNLRGSGNMQIVKQPVSLLPWGHIIRLLRRIKDPDMRHRYVTVGIATAGRVTFSNSRSMLTRKGLQE